jgi:hypothetical protein
MSAQALRTAVVQAAISDPAFLTELEKDATRAIEARFGKQPYRIQFVREQGNELSLVFPAKTEQLAKTAERTMRDLGDRKPTRGQFEAILIRRAWDDPSFVAQLRTNPRAAIEPEVKKYDSAVPDDKVVRAYIEEPGHCVIVVPSPSSIHESEELSETELEAVAGGEGIAIIAVTTIVAATAGVIVNEWVCGPKAEASL